MKIVWDEPKTAGHSGFSRTRLCDGHAKLLRHGKGRSGEAWPSSRRWPRRPPRLRRGLQAFGNRGYILGQLAAGERQGKAHLVTKKAAEKIHLTDPEIAARDAARGFTDADLAEVMDNPEWTDEQLRSAMPFAEICPELAAAIRRARTVRKS